MAPHGRVALGHARLSIIDLATGDQPIANEDERLHIVVNGEFYDYERIQRDLVARGHTLRTKSDSEIALHLYEDYGAAALAELRGEFAIVLWDEANGTLMAVRDRFGVKPLYYAQVGDTLYLASEAKALFCRRRAGPLGPRIVLSDFARLFRSRPLAVRGRAPGAAGLLSAGDATAHADCSLLGFRLPTNRRFSPATVRG